MFSSHRDAFRVVPLCFEHFQEMLLSPITGAPLLTNHHAGFRKKTQRGISMSEFLSCFQPQTALSIKNYTDLLFLFNVSRHLYRLCFTHRKNLIQTGINCISSKQGNRLRKFRAVRFTCRSNTNRHK